MENNCEHNVIVYWSYLDRLWIAHSLDMDKTGSGERVVDALANLIRASLDVITEAKKDHSLHIFRDAPPQILRLAEESVAANILPFEVIEIAYKMARGRWPENFVLDVFPNKTEGSRFKAYLEFLPGA